MQEVFTAQLFRQIISKKVFNPSQLPEYQPNKKPGYLATAGLLGEIALSTNHPTGGFDANI